MKKILFVASESLPFAKSGGLADVIGSLPKELVKKGHDVRVVMPDYANIKSEYRCDFKEIYRFDVWFGRYNEGCTVYEYIYEGVVFYFISHISLFNRTGLYGYDDDSFRFAFFQKAVLDMLEKINYKPDIIHCHDWHTGMIPCLYHEQYKNNPFYHDIKFVYTIHNLAYQGNFNVSVLEELFNLPYSLFESGKLRFWDGISYMKAGIIYADKVTTVSPTYANEILSEEYGEHMDQVLALRKDNLLGIVNGLDQVEWNPKTDKDIAFNYRSSLKTKQKNKMELQRQMGLRVDPNVCLIGVVSRLVDQKGFDLLVDNFEKIMAKDVQLVILGSGDSYYENNFRYKQGIYYRRLCFYCGYNNSVAHKIYAGADIFLMPSRFEPCGLSQLISMRYGTIPLVRETGGLKDTVEAYNEFTKTGNGFSFAPYNGHDLLYTIDRALYFYYDRKEDWENIVQNAFNYNSTWENSANKYLELYENM